MYYLTVDKNGEQITRRKAFDDYSKALQSLAEFYRPKTRRSVLSFTTEIINGQFARSFATLTDPEAIIAQEPFYRERYEVAVRQKSVFEFDGSYQFLIES